jgi:hypothetical protein
LESVLGATPQEFESPILRHVACENTDRRRLQAGALCWRGLIWWSQLSAVDTAIARIGRSCCAWSRASRTGGQRGEGGDDEPIALADRPAIKAILAESHPRKALMLWVQTVTDVVARTTPLGEVLIAAADIDPAAAQLLSEASRNRMLGATVFIRYLASLDGLAVGITEQRAAELCWALTDGHLYRLLVAQRSWSTADFNRWLSDSLAAALLPT